MESEIKLRDAEDRDYEQWRILFDQYNAFYGRVNETALADDIVRTTWARFLDPSEPVHCIVAEYENQLVGLTHYIFHRNTITIENTCYLQDLFSTPELRGKGIGRCLINTFYGRAADSGTDSVYWHTHSSNQTAMRLYDQIATNTEFVVYREKLRKTPG